MSIKIILRERFVLFLFIFVKYNRYYVKFKLFYRIYFLFMIRLNCKINLLNKGGYGYG